MIQKQMKVEDYRVSTVVVHLAFVSLQYYNPHKHVLEITNSAKNCG
jgi:hypothetical protein